MTDFIEKIQLDKKKIIFAVIILVFILYIDFYFILKKQFNKLRLINPVIVQLKKDIKKLDEDLSLLKVTKETEDQLGKASIKTVDKIIDEEKVTKALEDIAAIANKRKVKIMQMKPLRLSLTQPELAASETKFFPLLIILDISAGYHQFGRFINDLENASFFMEVEELQIRPIPMDYLNQNINLKLKTYVRR